MRVTRLDGRGHGVSQGISLCGQYWPEVQSQGVERLGFSRSISLWFADGHFPAGPHVALLCVGPRPCCLSECAQSPVFICGNFTSSANNKRFIFFSFQSTCCFSFQTEEVRADPSASLTSGRSLASTFSREYSMRLLLLTSYLDLRLYQFM